MREFHRLKNGNTREVALIRIVLPNLLLRMIHRLYRDGIIGGLTFAMYMAPVT
jgi:hypothetical protein